MTSATAEREAGALDGWSGGAVVAPWRFVLAGPGGVRSTTTDMESYLAAVLRPPGDACGTAIVEATTVRGPRSENRRDGLAWTMHEAGFLWHNGGTGGFRTMLAADRSTDRGVLVMANSADLDPTSAVLLDSAAESFAKRREGGPLRFALPATTPATEMGRRQPKRQRKREGDGDRRRSPGCSVRPRWPGR